MDRRQMLANLGAVSCFALPFQAKAAYLTKSLIDRPYATRCIEYPLQPCWIRRHDRPPT